MSKFENLNFQFDDLLYQVARGNTHEKLESNIRFEEFQQVREWKLKFGFTFNIYANDHLINGKPHFHFDNNERNIFCKFDFQGNLLESKGNNLDKRVYKELIYFLSKLHTINVLKDFWNEKNPDLKVD